MLTGISDLDTTTNGSTEIFLIPHLTLFASLTRTEQNISTQAFKTKLLKKKTLVLPYF